jgi:hypothetical protein
MGSLTLSREAGSTIAPFVMVALTPEGRHWGTRRI